MKVVIRHEGATEQEVEQTCVWVVGDDGETLGTEYLKTGQQVDLNIEGAAPAFQADFGEVGPIATPPQQEQASAEAAAAEAQTGQPNSAEGEGQPPTPGAPETPSGGATGGDVAQ